MEENRKKNIIKPTIFLGEKSKNLKPRKCKNKDHWKHKDRKINRIDLLNKLKRDKNKNNLPDQNKYFLIVVKIRLNYNNIQKWSKNP